MQDDPTEKIVCHLEINLTGMPVGSKIIKKSKNRIKEIGLQDNSTEQIVCHLKISLTKVQQLAVEQLIKFKSRIFGGIVGRS